MTTLSYVRGSIQEIVEGETYYFGQLWDGDGDGMELLESGAISPNNEGIVFFNLAEPDEDIMDTLVKVTGIA